MLIIITLLFLAGCTSSGRFSSTPEVNFTGRPVESFDGKYRVKIPAEWIVVDESENGALFTFTDTHLNTIISYTPVIGEGITSSEIISSIKAGIKINKENLNISETGKYNGVEGFHYSDKGGGVYNIFVAEVNGKYWESRLYIKPENRNKQEQIIRLQSDILKHIQNN